MKGDTLHKVRLLECIQYIKFKDLIAFLFFAAAMAAAYFVHCKFRWKVENIAPIVSIGSMIMNIAFSNHMVASMEKVKEDVPVQYKYLAERYQKLPSLNGWILFSMLILAIFAIQCWFDSMLIIFVYWITDSVVKWYKIRKEKNAVYSQHKEYMFSVFEKSNGDFKEQDLKRLLEKGLADGRNNIEMVNLFSEFFLCYLDEKITRSYRSLNRWISYEEIYNMVYESLKKIIPSEERLPLEKFFGDFIIELMKNRKINSGDYWKIILAAVISFASFESKTLSRDLFYAQLVPKVKKEYCEIINIMLLCCEFLFHYNERKVNGGIVLKQNTAYLYENNISLREANEKEIIFFRFLWAIWCKNYDYRLSDSILNFEGFIEYCKVRDKDSQYRLKDSEQSILKTKSLYILMKEIQMEQGMEI